MDVENKIKGLILRIAALEGRLNSSPSDAAEQGQLDGLILFVTISPLDPQLSPCFSELGRVEGQLRSLAEKPEPQAGEITGLLEDLRETIFNYQVRLSLEGHHMF